MTQSELAKGLFDRSYISQIESGKVIPPLSTLELLCERLAVPISDVVEGSHSKMADTKKRARHILARAREMRTAEELFIGWETLVDSPFTVELVTITRRLLSYEEDTSRRLYVLQRVALKMLDTGYDCEDGIDLLIQLGNTYFNANQYVNALSVYRTILEDKNPTRETTVRLLLNIGTTLYRSSQFHEAVDIYEQALELAEDTNAIEIKARCHHGLGISLRAVGELGKARDHTMTAAGLYQGIDESRRIYAIHNLGVILGELRHTAQAKSYLQESLRYYQTTNNYAMGASVLEELARIELTEGNLDSARTLCSEGLELVYQTTETTQMVRLLSLRMALSTGMDNRDVESNSDLQSLVSYLHKLFVGDEMPMQTFPP